MKRAAAGTSFTDMLQDLILLARSKSSDSAEKLDDISLKLKVDHMDKIAGAQEGAATEGFRAAVKTVHADVLKGTDFGGSAYQNMASDRAITALEGDAPAQVFALALKRSTDKLAGEKRAREEDTPPANHDPNMFTFGTPFVRHDPSMFATPAPERKRVCVANSEAQQGAACPRAPAQP